MNPRLKRFLDGVAVIAASIVALAAVMVLTPRDEPEPKVSAAQAQAEAKAAKARSAAFDRCLAAVQRAAQYPSKADFYFFDHATHETSHAGAPHWQVTGKVDLMNGFGAMIPHVYVCYVSIRGDQLADFWVVPE